MIQQDVDTSRHRQVKDAEPAPPAEIEQAEVVVGVAIATQLAHSDPFQVERDHALLGLVDAADLLVAGHLAGRRMPVDVEYHGHFPLQRVRLVKECRDPESRKRLDTQLADRVAMTCLDPVKPLHRGCRTVPAGRDATKHGLLENFPAEPV